MLVRWGKDPRRGRKFRPRRGGDPFFYRRQAPPAGRDTFGTWDKFQGWDNFTIGNSSHLKRPRENDLQIKLRWDGTLRLIEIQRSQQ